MGVAERWTKDEIASATGYQRCIMQVRFVDKLVGLLMARLKKQDLYDQSLIILVADHGAAFVPGAQRRVVRNNNCGGVLSIPLLIKTPHQRSGEVKDRNAESMDVFPTILKILGTHVDWPCDGSSLIGDSGTERPIKKAWDRSRSITKSAKFPERREAVARKIRLFGTRDDRIYPFSVAPKREIIPGRFQICPGRRIVTSSLR